MRRFRSMLAFAVAGAALASSGSVHSAKVQAATAQPAAVAGIGPGSFTWIGPGNIGGPVSDLAVDPSTPSKIFAATSTGLWLSSDGGASWSPVNGIDGGRVKAMTFVEIDPSNPSIVYAANSYLASIGLISGQVWKSIDGGATWATLPMTLPVNGPFAISGDGTTLLVGSGINGTFGVQRSTDGGVSWASSLSLTALAVAFVNGGPRALALRIGEALYSNDGGATWATSALSPSPASPRALGVSPTTSTLVYLVTDGSPGSLYKSIDGGVSYSQVSTLPSAIQAPVSAVWVDPANGNHLLVASRDLWQTTDGGLTFTKVSDSTLAPASPDPVNAIVSDPAFDGSTNRRVYFATGGGIYKADDINAVNATGTAGYTSLNNGLNITDAFSAAGSPVSGVVIGSSAVGTLRHAAGASTQEWTRVGDGGLGIHRAAFDPLVAPPYILFDPADANVFYDVTANVLRNTTGGTQPSEPIDGNYWNGSTYVCKSPPYMLTCGIRAAQFALLDPNAADTLFVIAGTFPGTFGIFKTTNAKAPLTPTTGPVWRQVIGPPFPVTTVAVQKGNSAIMWAGALTADGTGTLARTTNALADVPTWTTITMPAGPGHSHFAANQPWIALDPVSPAVAYVGLDSIGLISFEGPTLYKTTDAGATWTNAMGSGATGLPDHTFIRALVTHPTVPGWVYAGTDAGLYASADGGATWSLAPDGPVGVPVRRLSWMGRKLVVATSGRGVYVSSRPLDRSAITIETPATGTTTGAPFTVSGWAIGESALNGAGVDTIHIYALPASGPPIFLGVAAYGTARSDIGALYGSQFTNSGFTLTTDVALAPGPYTIVAFAHNALSGTFDNAAGTNITIAAPVSNGLMSIDTPSPGATLTSAFEVGGWAIDAGGQTGTGVDAMQFVVFPNDGASPGVFVGNGSYGSARADVGAAFGSRFTNSGYHFTITGLGPGSFLLGVYAHSTVTNAYSIVKTLHFTVSATALMSIDAPGPEAAFPNPTFGVAGWSIDRSVESTAIPGTGVDQLHVYAYPNPGSGTPPIFLGFATTGISRPDVAAAYGSRYANSGYVLNVDRAALGLTPGVYNIVVHSHSSVSGTFNNQALVRVTLQ